MKLLVGLKSEKETAVGTFAQTGEGQEKTSPIKFKKAIYVRRRSVGQFKPEVVLAVRINDDAQPASLGVGVACGDG